MNIKIIKYGTLRSERTMLKEPLTVQEYGMYKRSVNRFTNQNRKEI